MISNVELEEWRTSPLTREIKEALEADAQELLNAALTWDPENLRFKQGELQGLLSIIEQYFSPKKE